jgi:hypothetical protein
MSAVAADPVLEKDSMLSKSGDILGMVDCGWG